MVTLPTGVVSSSPAPSGVSLSPHLRTRLKFRVALRPQRPYGLLGTGSPGRPPRLSHGSWALVNRLCVQCCFTSTEVIRTIRDGEPRTSTSTSKQLPSSEWTGFQVQCCSTSTDDDELMLNDLRCQLTYSGQVVTNAEARFNKSLRPRKPEGSLGWTAQDVQSTETVWTI